MDDDQENIATLVKEMLETQKRRLNNVTQNVLELLAITIFADKRVLSSEIQAFVANVTMLQNDRVLSSDLTEAEIIKWYEINKQKLHDVIRHNVFEEWIDEKIEILKNFPDKHLLLRAMDEIAHADGEKHVSEKALEVLAAKKWANVLLQKYSRKWLA